jgi:hypothetical protein
VRFSEAKESALYFTRELQNLLKTRPKLEIEDSVLVSLLFFVKQLAGNKCR